MTTVVGTHAVGNMETWLAGAESRKAVFGNFCTRYRIFRHMDANRVSIVWENVDLAKMKALLDTPEVAATKARHSVLDPIDLYIEVEGG
ncbi:MAG: hypothetical protein ACRCVA_14640 [Phreatobacter sp.]